MSQTENRARKILLVGSGGREHALAWKMAQSKKVEKIYVAPGNAGTFLEEKCENIHLYEIGELVEFAKQKSIDLTVVGPEALLIDGIADEFQKNGLRIFAPNKQAAQLEGSKRFAKDFMQKYGVKTAAYRSFNQFDHAVEYTNMISYPIVVKASGLAAGKGVIICKDQAEAITALKDILLDEKFGKAGSEVVIEEFLEGFEASILSICDGKTILPFISAKDHKKIGEGETGLNTGGMGVVAPNPQFTSEHFKAFREDTLQPTLKGLQAEKIDFKGVIFFGLMITETGVYLLEYNTRFGDPETQAVLPLLNSDLLGVFDACLDEQLNEINLDWKNEHSCCVVGVSGGYPEAYEKGKKITIADLHEAQFFIAGANFSADHKMMTSGGRVINIVATGETLESAREKAYLSMRNVQFEKMVYRKDIGVL